MTKLLNKAALFSDIHFGRKNNSELHNQDCLDFIDWFCNKVKEDSSIDHIMFLGDWYEHRSSINGLTLKYAYEAAKKLNALDLPIYFITGNHDCYYRNNRDVYTTNIFESLPNFISVNSPIIIDTTNGKALITPYLFREEYTTLNEYKNIPVWFGHFEFKGFVVTGDNIILEHGPDPDLFSTPLRIFSGHFHKRQEKNNIVYIGNTFPADYSDSNDTKRGMALYQFNNDSLIFIDWEECPMYYNLPLSKLLKSPKKYLGEKNRIKCLVDVDVSFDECNEIKKTLTEKYGNRELVLTEPALEFELQDNLKLEEIQHESNSHIIRKLLKQISSTSIDNEKLIGIYDQL